MYQLELAGNKETEFTTNVTAESLYAQYDTNMNEYQLLDLPTDYHKDDKAISILDQQISVWCRQVTYKFIAGSQFFACGRMVIHYGRSCSFLKEFYPMQTDAFAVSQVSDMSLILNGRLSTWSKRETE